MHQKNEAFKSIEERRVLCAFASTGGSPVAVLWVRRSETNRPSKCLEDTRGELVRKGACRRSTSTGSEEGLCGNAEPGPTPRQPCDAADVGRDERFTDPRCGGSGRH